MVYNKHAFDFKLLMALLTLVIILADPMAAWSQDDPTISLVKTVEVREFEGAQVPTDTYVVQRGDSIARILQKRKVVGSGPLSMKILRMVLAFNPDLSDPNLIKPGQKLVMPTGPVEETVPETTETPAATETTEPPLDMAAPVKPAQPSPPADASAKTKVVTVRQGDSLSALLIQAGVPRELIFKGYIDLTLKLNPDIANPNLIYAGQKITLPLSADWAETVAALPSTGTGESTETPIMPKVPPTATQAEPERTAPTETSPAEPVVPPPPMPPSENVSTKAALGIVFTRIGEEFLSKGQHFLPLKTGGQISISTESFPIIELRNGHRIVLDLDRRLPKQMVEVIRSNWNNYTIFRPQKKESLAAMLDRLLQISHYYKIQNKGQPLIIEGEVRVKAQANWIIWPTEQDYQSGLAVLMTLPGNTSQGTAPEMSTFLAGKGIQVIDFYPKGNLIGPEPYQGPAKPTVEIKTVDYENQNDFILGILDLVGQKYETNLSIPLMQGQNSGTDFNFTVEAPIYFTRNGTNYVVSTGEMTDEVEDLLKKNKFKVVASTPAEGSRSLAERLLEAMAIKTSEGLDVMGSTRPKNLNIEVTVPGLLFTAGGKQTLLTPTEIPEELAILMAQPSRQVVRYRIANP